MMVGEPGAAVELTVGGLRPEWLSQAAPNWRELYFALAECGRLREAEAALAMVFLEHDDLRGPAAANLATLPWVVYQLDRRGAVDIADRCANRYERLSKWDGALSGDAGVRRMVRDQLLSADRLLDHGSIRQAGRLLKSVERNIEDLRAACTARRRCCPDAGRSRRCCPPSTGPGLPASPRCP
jgi:hypothetical protein